MTAKASLAQQNFDPKDEWLIDPATNAIVGVKSRKSSGVTGGNDFLPVCFGSSVASDSITATASGTQATAYQLAAGMNRVSVVATAADSVAFPPAMPGGFSTLINGGANALQLFGTGTDTVNGAAYATGVSIPAGALVTAYCVTQGAWIAQVTVFSAGIAVDSVTNAITAHAGGGQGSSVALTSQVNGVTVCATAGDSVHLPPSTPGTVVYVVNTGATACQVYGGGTDTINGVVTATGISMPPNSADMFICTAAGAWFAEVGVGFSGSLFTESCMDAITAHAGGGQASAYAITTQTARVTVVATAGDSIKLPVSAAGLELLIVNHGANPMQVYGAGSDTIDDVTAATGVSQMAGSMVIYTCPVAGLWYSEGLATGYSGSFQTFSSADALSANSGGVQAGATAITAMVSRFTTVGGAGYSAVLPAAAPGMALTVINAAAANAMNLFPAGSDAINALANSAALSVAAGTVVELYSTVAGKWHTVVTTNIPSLAPSVFNSINVGTGTLAAGNITGANSVTLMSTNATPGTQTTRTATLMFGDIPNCTVGFAYNLRITNTGAGTLTLGAGGGMTLTGTMTVPQNTFRDFVVTFNTSTTATIQTVGTGTYS